MKRITLAILAIFMICVGVGYAEMNYGDSVYYPPTDHGYNDKHHNFDDSTYDSCWSCQDGTGGDTSVFN